MNWPFFNLVHIKEFFQKKSDHPKFVGDGTEYANRSDNFPRFLYLDSLLDTLRLTALLCALKTSRCAYITIRSDWSFPKKTTCVRVTQNPNRRPG